MTTRFFHSPIPRRATAMFVAVVTLAWSGFAVCGEIHEAAKQGDLAQIQALLKGNPDLVFSKDGAGWTPLHCAAYYGHKDVAELLLTYKADVNARDNNGDAPLHLAVFEDHKDVAELLTANHAETNAKNNQGYTPSDLAALSSNKSLAELPGATSQNARKSAPGLTDAQIQAAIQRGIEDKSGARWRFAPSWQQLVIPGA